MIPLFCDLVEKRIVTVGGGGVALRKTRRFASEGIVTVHAPAFHAEFSDLDCEPVRERVDAERARELFDDAFLVVATDDEELNALLTTHAREQGRLVNRADRPGDDEDATTAATEAVAERASDVVVPSSIDVNPITVAISTGGRSPAMAKYLREPLEPVGEEAAPMVRLQSELRGELKRVVEGSDERRKRLWAVIENEAVWDALDAGERERARRLVRERAGPR